MALILQTVLGLWKKGVKDKLGIVIFAVIFALNLLTDISPVVLVIGCSIDWQGTIVRTWNSSP